jgi:hypothetical protein
MKLTFINDWQYLFSHDPEIGYGFTFLSISYMDIGLTHDIDIDGFSIIVLGLGIRIRT